MTLRWWNVVGCFGLSSWIGEWFYWFNCRLDAKKNINWTFQFGPHIQQNDTSTFYLTSTWSAKPVRVQNASVTATCQWKPSFRVELDWHPSTGRCWYIVEFHTEKKGDCSPGVVSFKSTLTFTLFRQLVVPEFTDEGPRAPKWWALESR